MDADGDLQPVVGLASEPVVEIGDHALDRARRPQRSLRGVGATVVAEQRADAVELHIAQRAAGGADRVADALDIERQHIQQILRQMIRREISAVAEVAEQHDDLALAAALRHPRAIDRPRRPHQRHDRNIALRAQLARQPHARRRADALQRPLLVIGRRRTELLARRHPHPAGRASRPAAAHRGMRQMKAAARLQHRPAPGHPHDPAGIGHRDKALAAALDQVADFARDESGADDGKIPIEQIVLPLRDRQPLHGVVRTQIFPHRRRRVDIGDKLLAHGDEAERRQHRQQQRNGKQHEPELPIPPAPVESEMQPEAAVQPARRHQAQLPALRAGRKQQTDHPRVVRRQPEQIVGKARRGGVADQQDRHREAEHDAEQFERRQTKRAPFIDRDQRHHEMNGEGAIEQNGARQAVPNLDRVLHAGLGRAERDQTERMVEKMRADIGEENEAGGHPQVPAQTG